MKLNFLPHLFVLIALSFVNSAAADCCAAENISVELVLNSVEAKDNTEGISAVLVIRNTGSTEVKIKHPANRMAVAFIVMNSLGNIVSPVGIAKVDPRFSEITIKPNSEFRQSFSKLEFITGSALFGYELKPRETYRVVAIYRPNGDKSPGITSGEQIITIK